MATAEFSPSAFNEGKSKTDIIAYHKPIARYGHSSCIVGDRMFLWCGGQKVVPITHNGRQKETFASNIETLNLKSGKWEYRQARGYSPAGIQYYAVTAVRTALYYFGGHCGHSGCYYNTLTKFDTTICKWEDVQINNLLEGPIAKYSSGITHFKSDGEDYLFIVGGYGKFGDNRQPGAVYAEAQGSPGSGRTNEQHIFCLSKGTWINPTVTGDCPPPCSNFSFTAINVNRAVLFGGYQDGVRSNDVFVAVFTKDSVHWTKFSQEPEKQWPGCRADHAAAYVLGHKNRQPGPAVLVTGGIDNAATVLHDVWMFSVDNGTWEKVDVPKPSVIGRLFHSMSIMNIGTEFVWLIIFGGIVSWTKGKSARDQELIDTTNVVELGWNGIEKKWMYLSTIKAESFSTSYALTLKDRIQRRKSLSL